MKFTSEDLMKAMGLQVGDRVKVENFNNSYFEVRAIRNLDINEYVLVDENEEIFSFTFIFNYKYEILPRPKRVGNLKCLEYECAKCPLRTIRCDKNDDIGNSFYYILDNVLIGYIMFPSCICY